MRSTATWRARFRRLATDGQKGVSRWLDREKRERAGQPRKPRENPRARQQKRSERPPAVGPLQRARAKKSRLKSRLRKKQPRKSPLPLVGVRCPQLPRPNLPRSRLHPQRPDRSPFRAPGLFPWGIEPDAGTSPGGQQGSKDTQSDPVRQGEIGWCVAEESAIPSQSMAYRIAASLAYGPACRA